MKYFIQNLGCQMNQADSERIQSVFAQMGLERTDDEAEARVLGIVACSVRQKAIDKVYTKIHEWNLRKESENLVTFVSGCILPADEEKFLDRFDLVFPVADLPRVPDLFRQYGVVTPLSQFTGSVSVPAAATLRDRLGVASLEPFWKVTPAYSSSFEAFVPIQNGCDKFCTFCAVPYTRGREVSRPSEDVLREVEALVAKGYKSITLLGQNVNSYGLDRPGAELSFAQLLGEVGKFGERSGRQFWTYFTSPHPRDMSREVLETVARYPVLAKQIHLPLQSGDDHVLIRMNRNHTMERYREVVAQVRDLVPEATLFTDIIVGFTGETDEQFQNTRRAMEEFRYQMAFVAQYSPRPGAASARWSDDVSPDDKKERLRVLTEVLRETSLEYNRTLIGRTVPVLVEKADKKAGFLSGRTEGRVTVRFRHGEGLVGTFVPLTITSAVPFSVEGEVVELPAGRPDRIFAR
jgi:tRNA-2-methylthio-N6-dimethylallyladenosine synthase